jgi:ribosome-dependent ATPase
MDEAERCTDVGYLYLSKLLVLGKPETLKQLPLVTPAGTTRFELKVPSPTVQLGRVRDIDGVRDATLFGEKLHLLADQALQPEQLRTQLGLDATEFEIQTADPSLEDVFVTLTNLAVDHGPDAVLAPTAIDIDSDDQELVKEADPTKTNSEKPVAEPPHFARSVSRRQGRELNGLWAILVKEFVHIRRQPTTLFFMFVVPLMQTIIFGYAINTEIENIPTVVLNLDGRTQSQLLVEKLRNTRRFEIVERVFDQSEFDQAIRSGRAQVGVIVPPNFSEQLLHGEQARVQVLIDGSDSQVASTAQNTAQLLGQSVSIELARRKGESLQLAPARDAEGQGTLAIEVRTRLLYNPDLESSNFFVPGLIGVILQLVTLFLTSFAVVRERELGTLEQLFVTPVGRTGLILGKLVPYAIVGIVEVVIMLVVMIYLFGVPVNGSIPLLISLSMLFTICSLGLGLFISTIAKTQMEAFQLAFVVMLPSILLSGFMFPRAEMPLPIYWASFALPATYFIEILRGIILRGAELTDLIPSVVGLSICCFLALGGSVMRFKKQLG